MLVFVATHHLAAEHTNLPTTSGQSSLVRIVGLSSKPELNGCLGRVVGGRTEIRNARAEASPDSPFLERYPVRLFRNGGRLESGKTIKCRASNLRLVGERSTAVAGHRPGCEEQ